MIKLCGHFALPVGGPFSRFGNRCGVTNGWMVSTALLGLLSLAPGVAAQSAPDDAVAFDSGIGAPDIVVTAIVPDESRLMPGSHDVVSHAAIEERAPLSLRDQLLAIPGLNIVEEDAGGLALNIGMRGLDPRRSARTLLMEDGVPLFLAPYGDPAAHYAPPVERVERIEVVRGSGQILYGPQTVGGMINFVTTPIPTNGPMLRGEARGGTRGFYGVSGALGTGSDKAGVLVEATTRGVTAYGAAMVSGCGTWSAKAAWCWARLTNCACARAIIKSVRTLPKRCWVNANMPPIHCKRRRLGSTGLCRIARSCRPAISGRLRTRCG